MSRLISNESDMNEPIKVPIILKIIPSKKFRVDLYGSNKWDITPIPTAIRNNNRII